MSTRTSNPIQPNARAELMGAAFGIVVGVIAGFSMHIYITGSVDWWQQPTDGTDPVLIVLGVLVGFASAAFTGFSALFVYGMFLDVGRRSLSLAAVFLGIVILSGTLWYMAASKLFAFMAGSFVDSLHPQAPNTPVWPTVYLAAVLGFVTTTILVVGAYWLDERLTARRLRLNQLQ